VYSRGLSLDSAAGRIARMTKSVGPLYLDVDKPCHVSKTENSCESIMVYLTPVYYAPFSAMTFRHDRTNINDGTDVKLEA
jgi:hypothetical protein